MLRGFLIRLIALDSQLEDNKGARGSALCIRSVRRVLADWITGEMTFGVILETDDDLEPRGNKTTDGVRPDYALSLAFRVER